MMMKIMTTQMNSIVNLVSNLDDVLVCHPKYNLLSINVEGSINTVVKGSTITVGKYEADEFNRLESTKLKIDEDCTLSLTGDFLVSQGGEIDIYRKGFLEVGKGFMNYNSKILCSIGIKIGNGIAIGREVIIRDSNEHKIGYSGVYSLTTGSTRVVIGDNVWIGDRAMILPGAEIGDGCVIGAGAIVSRSIPPNSLVVGFNTIIHDNIIWEL